METQVTVTTIIEAESEAATIDNKGGNIMQYALYVIGGVLAIVIVALLLKAIASFLFAILPYIGISILLYLAVKAVRFYIGF